MANVLVEENVLSNIASAIREKNGTSTQYYPGQFAEEIRKIESGGGSSGENADLAKLIDGTISSITNSNVTTVRSYAFEGCSNLTTINFPNCSNIENLGFYNCINLTDIVLPSCHRIQNQGFYYCINLSFIGLPACSYIHTEAFRCCYNLINLTIDNPSVCNLFDSTAFNSTPIAGYTASTDGVYGSIYVPASLVSAYKSASNWSYYSNRITAIEEEEIPPFSGG